MTADIHATMHHEHQAWEAENSLWRDDIRAWQHELAQVLASLKDVEGLLNSHGEALRTHAAAIRLWEMESATHEHALVDFEKGASGEELLPMAKKHQTETTKQTQHRDAHERIKHYHHALIARANQLIKALQQPM